MRDAGTSLRELGTDEQLERWRAGLPRYAALQLAMAPRTERFLALGVPDERIERLAGRFESLLADPELLLVGHRDGVSKDELVRLRAAVPQVRSMCDELAAAGIPDSIQHDDLNDGQVYERDGRLRILDWADSCVSHPFHTMVVMLRSTAIQRGLVPGGPELLRLRDAYLEPFEELASPGDLRHLFGLAYRTGTIGRALAWSRSFTRYPEERDDTVAHGLKMFLGNGPIGSWES